MSLEPDVALEEFLSAIREHYAAAAHRSSDEDPRVEATYMALAEAFDVYEDALYRAFEEVTPFELFDDQEDAKADLGDDDDDDDFDDDFDDDDDDYDEDDDDDDFGDDYDDEVTVKQ
ncbi:hypothetical protein ACSFCK_09600 [Brevibacterium luteolum]|uniref:hypothetical protein n=1 Tax=Brevibacterium luteolum TaxID=199591 RepID=UPI003EEEB76D